MAKTNKMKLIKETCTKGTNIYLGNKKRDYLNKCINILKKEDFTEIQIPILQEYKYFQNKVGEENNNMMYKLTDRKNRELCLAPEYTSIIINLKNTFKYQKNIKLFYIGECFRGENPQKGRYRQFTQLGVEIINPTKDYINELIKLASVFIEFFVPLPKQIVDISIKRGLDYYKEGKGFEIRNNNGLQLCGGGEYENGIGFAIGVDRLIL